MHGHTTATRKHLSHTYPWVNTHTRHTPTRATVKQAGETEQGGTLAHGGTRDLELNNDMTKVEEGGS